MAEIMINGTPIAKLRVVDLKNELDARGLSKSGKKDELVARLLSYMEVIIFISISVKGVFKYYVSVFSQI